jgi:hypothetical protein
MHSCGDDVDEALRNAPEAVQLYAESLASDGRALPRPRALSELKIDPTVSVDLAAHMVAVVEYRVEAHAAE